MRKFLLLASLLGGLTVNVMAQTVSGRLADENKQPLSYANVVLLAPADSAFVTGTISADDGSFSLTPSQRDRYLVRISSVGYATVYRDCPDGCDLGLITMQPDAQLLGEVVVKADLPKTRVKGDAMLTTVAGSILEMAGTGENVLDKIPGVSASDGEVEVFGRGTPEIYLNGRKVRDMSELDRLSSEDIKTVEVVTNPGARYDASVPAVIRIHTKKAQGEGFGFNNRLMGQYRYDWTGLEQFNFNYRKNGFDLSGMLYGSIDRNEDNKDVVQTTYLDKTWVQDGRINSVSHAQELAAMLSLNYQFNENHSMGVRYDYDRTPKDDWDINMVSQVYQDADEYEYSASQGTAPSQSTSHTANLYYNGQVNDWNIDFNADGYWNKGKEWQFMNESITPAGGTEQMQEVNTMNQTDNKLYAAKLIVSHPLWGGNFSVGGEYTYSSRGNLFANEQGILSDDDSEINENAAAAFVDYTRSFGNLQAQVGVRYEHLASDYYEEGVWMEDQSRTYDNVFPSVSLSLPVGKVQLQLNYAGSINRPSYWLLRGNVTYANRYTYENGNPLLRPTIIQRLDLNASYKWIYAGLSYQHGHDGWVYRGEQYDANDPTITLLNYVNIDDWDKLYASVSLSPTIGLWSPQWQVMLSQQWFPADTPDGHTTFNNPMATFMWQNHFKLPKGWGMNIDGDITTRGDSETFRLAKPFGSLDFGLSKSFLKNSLTLQLWATDLLNTSRAEMTLYSGNRLMHLDQDSRRRFRLTIRYRFNATKSKYKGTGAGREQRSRM